MGCSMGCSIASVVVVSVSRSLIFTGGVGCSIGFSSCRICI